MKNKKFGYRYIQKKLPDLISNDDAYLKIIADPRTIKAWQSERRKELLSRGEPLSWAMIGVVYHDPYIIILRDLVEFPDGRLNTYFRVFNQADLLGGQGAVIMCRLENQYLLLRQYRHPIRSWSYEFPRGFGEPGVSAEEQARREVREEVGGEVETLIDLGAYCSNTGLEATKVRLFYATLSSVGNPAKNEGIESIQWVSVERLEQMIASGEIFDGFTVGAYARAKLRGVI